MPPRRSRGRPKSFIFQCFFNDFAFLGLLGAILAQHGLQDTSENLQDASKSLQDASQSLQDASKTAQDASKSFQDAAKTLPWDTKKIIIS